MIDAVVHDTFAQCSRRRVDGVADAHDGRNVMASAKDTVARIWRARKLRMWRVETFKLSNDPNFEAKLLVVGLCI